MSTIMRPASRPNAGGRVDPASLLAQLAREGKGSNAFATGRMRLQPLANQAQEAGVPSVADLKPPKISPWETGILAGISGWHPSTIPYTLAGALPAGLYNRLGMSLLQLIARNSAAAGAGVGAGGGQVAADVTGGGGGGP